jgi:hypothetical protein
MHRPHPARRPQARDSRTGAGRSRPRDRSLGSPHWHHNVFVFLGEHRPEQYDAWLDSLDYLESLSPKRVIAGRSRPGLPEGVNAIEWTRRYIDDFRTFAKMAGSAAEMTDMLRVRNPNAIGFPASDGQFEMPTEVATGEIALVG